MTAATGRKERLREEKAEAAMAEALRETTAARDAALYLACERAILYRSITLPVLLRFAPLFRFGCPGCRIAYNPGPRRPAPLPPADPPVPLREVQLLHREGIL